MVGHNISKATAHCCLKKTTPPPKRTVSLYKIKIIVYNVLQQSLWIPKISVIDGAINSKY